MYSWSGMSFTAIEENLIEEIGKRLDDWSRNEYHSGIQSVE